MKIENINQEDREIISQMIYRYKEHKLKNYVSGTKAISEYDAMICLLEILALDIIKPETDYYTDFHLTMITKAIIWNLENLDK